MFFFNTVRKAHKKSGKRSQPLNSSIFPSLYSCENLIVAQTITCILRSQRTKSTYRSITSFKRHRDVKNSRLTTSKRHHDVINLWQKQARSHATKTGVHHLKNGVHHFYTFQKCSVWTNEKSSSFRLLMRSLEFDIKKKLLI